MRWLLFLSRLAFISGFCILIHISIALFGDWIGEENILYHIIFIGYFLGAITITASVLCYLVLFVIRKKNPVRYWLIIANFIFFIAILLFVLLNIQQDNAQNIHAP